MEINSATLSSTFTEGSGIEMGFISSMAIGLALVMFSIWVITGAAITLKSKNSTNEEKMIDLLYLMGLMVVWVAFIFIFTKSL